MKKEKVYCSNCNRLKKAPSSERYCRIPIPYEDYFERTDHTRVVPEIQNSNNACKYFEQKEKKSRRSMFWRKA